MEIIDLPLIQRKALLPIMEFRREEDPPPEIAQQFQLHDLLQFIGYLRQQGLEFQTRDQVQDKMPHLYARAKELIDVVAKEERYKGVIRHPIELLLTQRKGRYLRQQSKGPEVVAMLRELYGEGYNLVTPVLQREIKNLYLPMTFLGANTMTADDRYPLRAAIISAGIDALVAEQEVEEHKQNLLPLVREYLDLHQKVPVALVQELRKVFPGSNDFELRYSVIEGVRRIAGEVRYQGTYTIDRFVDFFDLRGFGGIGSRNFGQANPERPLEVRCQDAFVRMYQQSQRKIIDRQFIENFSAYFNYLYNALKKRHGSLEKALVDFYGLEKIKFKSIDDADRASVAAPSVAQSLRLALPQFYLLAQSIHLPLLSRDMRTFPFLHAEHAQQVLNRAQEKFAEYERH